MGMTLWIHTLEGRDMSRESDDHSIMHDLADDLDAICRTLKVAELSSFFDSTDLELNMSEEEDEDDDPEIDPETGWAYGIDDMQWFDAASGLESLSALRSHVETDATPLFEEDTKSMLLEELDDCIQKLRGPAQTGGKFHLAVIM